MSEGERAVHIVTCVDEFLSKHSVRFACKGTRNTISRVYIDDIQSSLAWLKTSITMRSLIHYPAIHWVGLKDQLGEQIVMVVKANQLFAGLQDVAKLNHNTPTP